MPLHGAVIPHGASFGGGASLEELQALHLMPDCMTHAMFRVFLKSADATPIMAAVRQAQAHAFAGPPWMGTVLSQTIYFRDLAADREQYLQARIAWLCAHPFDEQQVVRVTDYLQFGGGSMDSLPDRQLHDGWAQLARDGRVLDDHQVTSLIQAVDAWHDLRRDRAT
jgi:hypothetical protein